jgi:hypothetical protein
MSQGAPLDWSHNAIPPSPSTPKKVWVYGDSYQAKLVAVVVPGERPLLNWAKDNGKAGARPPGDTPGRDWRAVAGLAGPRAPLRGCRCPLHRIPLGPPPATRQPLIHPPTRPLPPLTPRRPRPGLQGAVRRPRRRGVGAEGAAGGGQGRQAQGLRACGRGGLGYDCRAAGQGHRLGVQRASGCARWHATLCSPPKANAPCRMPPAAGAPRAGGLHRRGRPADAHLQAQAAAAEEALPGGAG